MFGKIQKQDQEKAGHIRMLARMFPGLRIAHVDEIEGEFFSVLSKNAGGDTDNMVEEYRIKVRYISHAVFRMCAEVTATFHIFDALLVSFRLL